MATYVGINTSGTSTQIEEKRAWARFARGTVSSKLNCVPIIRTQASVPANNNLKSRLRARKYSKCMKTWHEASTSGHCSRELNRNSKVVY